MIDEQEIKNVKPTLVWLLAIGLLPRISSPTLQESTQVAPPATQTKTPSAASLIQQTQEAVFGILPTETSVMVKYHSWTREDQLLEW